MASREDEQSDANSKLQALSEFAHSEGGRASELQVANARLEDELRLLQPQLAAAVAELSQSRTQAMQAAEHHAHQQQLDNGAVEVSRGCEWMMCPPHSKAETPPIRPSVPS